MHRPFLRPFAAALLVLTACATGPSQKHVKPQLGVLPPPPERLQVPLAIRYDPAFSRAWHGHGGRTNVVLIGEDSVALLDEIVPLVTERLERIAPPPAAPPPGAFVLEPSLEHFDFFDWGEKPSDAHAIVFRMSLFEPGGGLVSSWTVEGRVPFVRDPPADSGHRPPAHAVSSDPEPPTKDGLAHASENLSDAARRFVAGFRRDSRIDAFLARRAAGEPLLLDSVEVHAAFEDLEIRLPGLAPTLYGAGLVPVKVRIVNRGTSEVHLSGLTARLDLADGRSVRAPGPRMIARRIEAASNTAAARKMGYGNLFGPIAIIAHQTKLRAGMPAVREMLEARALRALALAPGAAVEGHLFFLAQEGAPPSDAATFSLWLVDEDLRSTRGVVILDLPARPPPETSPPPDEAS